MFEDFIVPKTVVTEKGDSSPIGIGAASSRIFLAVLQIDAVVEQEGIEIALYGSGDGTTWGAKPVATLPQRFYPGKYPTLIDLTADQDTKVLKAHWEVVRWGRGDQTPRFEFSVSIREVPAALLQQGASDGQIDRNA